MPLWTPPDRIEVFDGGPGRVRLRFVLGTEDQTVLIEQDELAQVLHVLAALGLMPAAARGGGRQYV